MGLFAFVFVFIFTSSFRKIGIKVPGLNGWKASLILALFLGYIQLCLISDTLPFYVSSWFSLIILEIFVFLIAFSILAIFLRGVKTKRDPKNYWKLSVPSFLSALAFLIWEFVVGIFLDAC